MANPVRVLVVDDSALARKILSDLLNQHPEIEVVGTAQDGGFVMNKINQLKPDVITLDVEMRNKGGLEVLPEIVKTHGLPVIMVSAHTDRGAEATIKALELGAVDFVAKPQAGGASLTEISETLSSKIIAVGRSRRKQGPVTARIPRRPQPAARPTSAPLMGTRAPSVGSVSSKIDLIAIGASTGGTEAIKDVLVPLPTNLPGIVIVQHMPAGFTRAFANRINTLCALEVKEAEDGDRILPGTALIAPGSHHMEVVRGARGYSVRLLETPPVNRHRPSVDVLFDSVAKLNGRRSLGVILTGMGGDGAKGMKRMRDTGAETIAQDEASCVVFGMPKEAIKLGGAVHTLPLDQIPQHIVKALAPAARVGATA